MEQVEDTITGHRLQAVLAERAATGSRPGARRDGHRVALAVEGGGMRGAVSAGMALAVYELGLLPMFDMVYGASAGAISAAWLLSSRPEGLRGWVDPTFGRGLIRRRNMLRGRPVVNLERLIEVVYVRDFPLDYASVLANPVRFHPVATDVVTGAAVDLHPDIVDEATLRLAIRASAALPILAGGPVALGARRYYDAGLAESIPYGQALRDGATHVLVLRSRRNADRIDAQTRPSRFVSTVGLRKHTPELRAAFLSRSAKLADDDRILDEYDADTLAPSGPAVMSIRPPDSSPRIGRLKADNEVLHTAFETGHAAGMAVLSGIPVG